jgi:ferredoxin
LAIIGVRACDLAALAMQDRHFVEDARYQERRHRLLLVGVDCAFPAATCFCASTGDGPGLQQGYDIGLSESDHGMLIWAGTDQGATILEGLGLVAASAAQLREAADNTKAAARQQQRALPGRDRSMRLGSSLNHPAWSQVAERCLACGNCTAVCPSCFCHSIVSRPALDGVQSQQVRQWDSCFNQDHSIMHGHAVRDSIQLRYRQWLTHKLAGWHAQFGRSGCVGCGRCISWCPVGIDITQVTASILEETA